MAGRQGIGADGRRRRPDRHRGEAALTPAELLTFLRSHRLAVQASVAADGAPQAALVGVAVTDAFEVVFDTLATTRKVANLRRDPRIALVFGWNDERTAQYEGVADEPRGEEIARVKAAYFRAFPDGRERERWPGITYVRVRPTWIRFSDFGTAPPRIEEFRGESLRD